MKKLFGSAFSSPLGGFTLYVGLDLVCLWKNVGSASFYTSILDPFLRQWFLIQRYMAVSGEKFGFQKWKTLPVGSRYVV